MKAIEVTTYQIKQDKMSDINTIQEVADYFLKKQKGFINRRILQDDKDNTIFMDIVEWDTIENAENAAKIFPIEPTLKPFMDAIEKVISFSHLHPFN